MKTEYEIAFKVVVDDEAASVSTLYQMDEELMLEAVHARATQMVSREMIGTHGVEFDPKTVMVSAVRQIPDAAPVENVLANS